MTERRQRENVRFDTHVLRPASIISSICQMIIGAGLAVALILKIYMFVLTDHQCAADSATLGNAIRCTPALEMAAYALALAAGFELARLLFESTMEKAMKPLLFGLSSTFLFLLAGMSEQTVDWQTALTIVALTLSLTGGMAFRFWIRQGKREPMINPDKRESE